MRLVACILIAWCALTVTASVGNAACVAEGPGEWVGQVYYSPTSNTLLYCGDANPAWSTVSTGGGQGDRIVSGTTQMVAISNTGYISVTTAGVTTGYFSPAGVLVANGISVSTNQMSATTIYASDQMSIRGVPLIVTGTSMVFGRTSGASITAGTHASLGYQTLNSATSAAASVAFGYQALASTTTGSFNSAVGYRALLNNTTGARGTAVGFSALLSNGIGTNNTAVGSQALQNNTSGANNVAIGQLALMSQQNGNGHTAVGGSAMANISGTAADGAIGGTAVGFQALFGNTTAGNNTGDYNTALGFQAGMNIDAGNSNTLVGYRAGDNITTGSGNILIGYDIATTSNTSSNQLNIGDSIFGDMADAASTTGGAARIGINWVTPSVALEVSGTVSATTAYFSNNVGIGMTSPGARLGVTGNVSVTGGVSVTGNIQATAYLHTSDIRLKENVTPIADATGLIGQLRGTHFIWKKDGRPAYGLIAQEVEMVLPELVPAGEGLKTVDYDQLVPILIEAVKELNAANDNKEKAIDGLETRIRKLEVGGAAR